MFCPSEKFKTEIAVAKMSLDYVVLYLISTRIRNVKVKTVNGYVSLPYNVTVNVTNDPIILTKIKEPKMVMLFVKHLMSRPRSLRIGPKITGLVLFGPNTITIAPSIRNNKLFSPF